VGQQIVLPPLGVVRSDAVDHPGLAEERHQAPRRLVVANPGCVLDVGRLSVRPCQVKSRQPPYV